MSGKKIVFLQFLHSSNISDNFFSNYPKNRSPVHSHTRRQLHSWFLDHSPHSPLWPASANLSRIHQLSLSTFHQRKPLIRIEHAGALRNRSFDIPSVVEFPGTIPSDRESRSTKAPEYVFLLSSPYVLPRTTFHSSSDGGGGKKSCARHRRVYPGR